jgi:hypothetical protein
LINISFICQDWKGVSCDQNNQLTGLFLQNSLGDGTTIYSLPDIFSSLPSLQYCNLSGNFLHGPLPPSFASLSFLETLDLSSNYFGASEENATAGADRRFLLTALTDYVDPLFQSIRNLTSLRSLSLNENGFIGQLPASLCEEDLPFLESLVVMSSSDRIILRNNFTCMANCLAENPSLDLDFQTNGLPICEYLQTPPTSSPTLPTLLQSNSNPSPQAFSSLLVILPISIILFLCLCVVICGLLFRRNCTDQDAEKKWKKYLETSQHSEEGVHDDTLEEGLHSYDSDQASTSRKHMNNSETEPEPETPLAERNLNQFFNPSQVHLSKPRRGAHPGSSSGSSSSSGSGSDSDEQQSQISRVISQKSSTDGKIVRRKFESFERFVPRMPSSQSSSTSIQLEELHVIISRGSTPSSSPAASLSDRSTSNDTTPPRRRGSFRAAGSGLLRAIRSNPEMIIHHRPSLQLVQLSRSNSSATSKPVVVGKGDLVESSEDEEFFVPYPGSEDSDQDGTFGPAGGGGSVHSSRSVYKTRTRSFMTASPTNDLREEKEEEEEEVEVIEVIETMEPIEEVVLLEEDQQNEDEQQPQENEMENEQLQQEELPDEEEKEEKLEHKQLEPQQAQLSILTQLDMSLSPTPVDEGEGPVATIHLPFTDISTTPATPEAGHRGNEISNDNI